MTVAEVSGDRHAAGLIKALRQLEPDIIIEGFGGPEMAAAGATILYETTCGAAMTLHGVRRVFEVSRLLKRADHYYRQHRPDLQICVDSSAMNLPFARVARCAGVAVMYYVAPQVWASRESRIKKIRQYVDRLACIFPFEQEYFRAHGVDATFVGHPLFDQLPRDRVPPDASLRFPNRPAVIGIVPGSRKSEVAANLSPLLEVAGKIHERFGDSSFLIPTTAAVDAFVRERLPDGFLCSGSANSPGKGKVTIACDAFDQLIRQCDLCLCKSGTSTVHVAAWNVPMIIVYRVSPLLWHLAGRWLVKTRKIGMVNILAGQQDMVPEFIPFSSTQAVADCAIDLLENPQKLDAQRRALAEVIAPLDRPGASDSAARVAMELIKRKG
jgi:lipid-A-disaccharide synthase